MIPRLTSPMSSTRPLFGMYPSEERIAEVASQGSAVLTLEIPKGSGQQYRVFPIFLHPVIERDLVQQYQTQGFTFNDKYLYVGLPVTSNGEYDQRS